MEAGWLTIWTLPDRDCAWFDLSKPGGLEAAAENAMRRSDKGLDAYYGVGLRREKLTGNQRGSSGDVSILPALFADIDIKDETAHKNDKFPETVEEALGFLNELPCPPTTMVHSGHGIHAYWLLEEPIAIDTPEDQKGAEGLLTGWQAFINQQAAKREWEFDHVADLARVLRVPGTINHKDGGAVPVTLLEGSGVVYDASDLSEWLVDPEPSSAADTEGFGVEYDRVRGRFNLPDQIPEGGRNRAMFQFACSLRTRRLSAEAIEAALLEENARRCSPPLPDSEIRTIARSAGKYPPGVSKAWALRKAQQEFSKETTLEDSLAGEPAMEEGSAAMDLADIGDTAEDILSDKVLTTLASMDDEVERQRLLSPIREKARKLGMIRSLDAALKARRKEIIVARYAARMEDGPGPEELITLPGIPLTTLAMPQPWIVDENGIRRTRQAGEVMITDWACKHPVIIIERMTNVDTATEKVRLSFLRDGTWQDLVVDRAVAASKQAIVQTANSGMMVTSENAKYLVQYLNELEAVNTEFIPRNRSVTRAGWIGTKQFSPYASDLSFDGELYYRDLYQAIRSEGDYQTWIDATLEARKNPYVRSVMAASFASPLVALLKKLVFFVHLWGDTGTGKSVALHVAASIWGDPMVLIKTFNATKVGLERTAAFMHSLPLMLDEFQTMQRKKEEVDSIIYTLGEGISRSRGTRGGGVEVGSRWANIIITNGEEPMTTDISAGGAKNRAIELYTNKALFTNPAATASMAHEHYGHAGKQFIERLIQDVKHNGVCTIRAIYETFRNELDPVERYTDKQLTAVAMLCTADSLASTYIYGLNSDSAIDQAYDLGEDITALLQTTEEIDVTRRAWDWLAGWAASNYAHFTDDAFTFRDPRYGKYIGSTLWIIKSVLDKALKDAGFDPTKCLSAWAEAKKIETRETCRPLYSIQQRIGRGRPLCCGVPYQSESEYGRDVND